MGAAFRPWNHIGLAIGGKIHQSKGEAYPETVHST
jgi:hypothetical protein